MKPDKKLREIKLTLLLQSIYHLFSIVASCQRFTCFKCAPVTKTEPNRKQKQPYCITIFAKQTVKLAVEIQEMKWDDLVFLLVISYRRTDVFIHIAKARARATALHLFREYLRISYRTHCKRIPLPFAVRHSPSPSTSNEPRKYFRRFLFLSTKKKKKKKKRWTRWVLSFDKQQHWTEIVYSKNHLTCLYGNKQ